MNSLIRSYEQLTSQKKIDLLIWEVVSWLFHMPIPKCIFPVLILTSVCWMFMQVLVQLNLGTMNEMQTLLRDCHFFTCVHFGLYNKTLLVWTLILHTNKIWNSVIIRPFHEGVPQWDHVTMQWCCAVCLSVQFSVDPVQAHKPRTEDHRLTT